MFTVYINHFQSGANIINSEQEMFSVPTTTDLPVQRPIVKASEDAADNFSFTMEANSPYYDALLPLKTLIRVVYDGDTIFYGRVLSISTSSAYQTKNVTCEGWYAFLNDSVYEGLPEKNRADITVDAYYTKLINNHNTSVPDKQIIRGNVGVTLPVDVYKYEPSAWTQTASLISNLASNHGGHMKIRYVGNGTPYLDWYKYYARDLGRDSRPQIKIGRNILDISSDQNPDDIFTRLIPIGDSGKDGTPIYIDGVSYTDRSGVVHVHSGKTMPVSLIRSLYTDVALNDDFHNASDYTDAESTYGVIYKTMTFSDADTKEKLWNYAKDWIKNSYFGLASSFTVKAIDMHIINGSYPKILLGDCVNLIYPITRNGSLVWENKKLVCKSIQYDLFDPDNNSYTLGIPTDVLEHNKNNKKSSKSGTASEASAPKSFGGGGGIKGPETFESIYGMIIKRNGNSDYEGTAAAESFYANGPLSGTVTCFDPQETSDPMNHKELWFKATLIGKITLPGRSTKYVALSSEKGIFAFTDTGVLHSGTPYMVTYWYVKKSGLTYEGDPASVSTFESIATMIESDSSSYGGSSNAAYFRNYGEVSGSLKCFDPETVDPSATTIDASKIFNVKLVGKIGPAVYVGVSSEYGILACAPYSGTASHRGLCQVVHWYSKAKGIAYDNSPGAGGLFTDANGDITATDNGYLDGNKTVWMKPTQLTGYGSEGQILIGYDLTAPGDLWRIGLNVPIQYENEAGESVIADGFVSAHDFAVGSIPSFKTKLAVIDLAIVGVLEAQRAFIQELHVVEGDIETLTTQKLTTSNLSSEISNLSGVTVSVLDVNSALTVNSGGYFTCNGIINAYGGIQTAAGAIYNVLNANLSEDEKTLTITKVDGEIINFNKAVPLTTRWTGNVNDGQTFEATAGDESVSFQLDGNSEGRWTLGSPSNPDLLYHSVWAQGLMRILSSYDLTNYKTVATNEGKAQGNIDAGVTSEWVGNQFVVTRTANTSTKSLTCIVTMNPSSDKTLDYGESVVVKAIGNVYNEMGSVTITAPPRPAAPAYTMDPASAVTLNFGQTVNVKALADGTQVASVNITAPSRPAAPTYTISPDSAMTLSYSASVTVKAYANSTEIASVVITAPPSNWQTGYDAVTIASVTRTNSVVTAVASNGATGTLSLTAHTKCADSLTKAGQYSILYKVDASGISVTTKLKNISAAGRYWYYRASEQNLQTWYS